MSFSSNGLAKMIPHNLFRQIKDNFYSRREHVLRAR